MKRDKTIAFTITEKEFEKIKQLAEIRHMNPTEYSRHIALGNRIKPTVVEFNETDHSDKIAELENNITILEELLEQQRVEFNHSLKPLAKHIKHNGYLQWNEYRDDDDAIEVLRRIRQLNDME